MKHPLVVVVGPTAVGKSKLAVKIGQRLDGEIVSADSMQVYRYMDIGTAKITLEEQEGIRHHLINIVDPGEPFNVAKYKRMAEAVISDIHSHGKLPIMVGGTGLYVKAVVDGLDVAGYGADQELRARLHNLAETKGTGFLYDALMEIDPETALRLHRNDLRRIIRALEVYYTTGTPISQQQRAWENPDPEYLLVMVGLIMNRTKLYQRINDRVDKMIEDGLVHEVRNLMEQGYLTESSAAQALGYKEIVEYLVGKCSFEEAVFKLKQSTRRYAKRQLTWFRKDSRITWFTAEDYEDFSEMTDRICEFVSARIDTGIRES